MDWDDYGYGYTACGAFNTPQYQNMLAADQSAAPRLGESEEKGVKCEVKDVFFVESNQPHERGVFRWVDEKPAESEGTKKTQNERETYAIVKYNHHDIINEKWDTAYIRVNNVKIQNALAKVLEGYPGLTQHGLQMFAPPYLPFFHRWDEFTKHIDDQTDEETFHYLDLLRKMLLKELEGTFKRWEEIQKTGHIGFDDLQLAFDPGEVAVYVRAGTRSAGIIRKCNTVTHNKKQAELIVELDVIDWDGRKCGLLSRTLRMEPFVGLRAFTALDIAPLLSFEDKDSIRKELVARGRIFEKLRGQHFLAFTDKDRERLNERVMIDALAFYKLVIQSEFPTYRNLSEIGRLTWVQSMQRYSAVTHDTRSHVYPHQPVPISLPGPTPPGFSGPISTEGVEEPKIDLTPLTDDECLLCVHEVRSFNIENKIWGICDVTKLHEISWNTLAFGNLVLNSEEKALLLALVNRRDSDHGKPFDDFISGKGQGMVMLLSGPPGVGKTFTAESIAEHLRRPLYKINAGELGISAQTVEFGLSNALKLCSRWKAVCLIDEADVFMAARTVDNLQRNELVSVFLRLLEYHTGILVLTTNRLHTLDSAFESRIDLTLMYKSLTEADRKQVWKNFLRYAHAKDVDINEAGLDELASWDVNGRQIKSAVKTARILAGEKQEPLSMKHLELVLSLRLKALSFMNGANKE